MLDCFKILIPLLISLNSIGQIQLTGLLTDEKTNEPIAYANIGILHGSKGTVSNLSGNFNLTITSSQVGDTIKFSSIGYHSKVLL